MPINIAGINNRYVTDSVIAKESLRRLKHSLILPRLANHNLTPYFENKVGKTISIKKPYYAKVSEGREVGPNDVSPMVDLWVDVTVDKRYKFLLEDVDEDKTFNIVDFGDRYLQAGVEDLAYYYDHRGAEALNSGTFNCEISEVGKPMSVKAASLVRAHSQEIAIPQNSRNYGLIEPMDYVPLGVEVRGTDQPQMVRENIRRQFGGYLQSWMTFSSTNLTHYITGKHTGTPKVRGANQTGDTLITDGWSIQNDQGVLKKGEIITIDGVYEIKHRGNKQKTHRLKQFVVQEDVNVDNVGAKTASIKIAPEINPGVWMVGSDRRTVTKADGEGNNVSLEAFQNVSAPPADDTPVNFVGDANSEYRQAFFFERSAMQYINVQLVIPQSFFWKGMAVDTDTGLNCTMVAWPDGNTMKENRRVDIMFGSQMVYPDIGIRLITEKI